MSLNLMRPLVMNDIDAPKFVAQPVMHACNCIGPQRGEPRCPCAMRGVIKRDGRWIQTEVDLGPAP